MDIERSNFEQIERLNQRGGRTLSVIDLIQAGTLSVEMAAAAMRAVHEGASLLTGARPGGAGKTTLMASFLHLLPPGEEIVTVDSPRVLAAASEAPCGQRRCYLVHEIGSGHWYGYLWGPAVGEFVALAGPPRRIASCLHADLLEELVGIICAPPLDARPQDVVRVGLILFMHVAGRVRPVRRVGAFYQADGRGGHLLRYRWNEATDTFDTVQPWTEEQVRALGPYTQFLSRLLADGVRYAEDVRAEALRFYAQHPLTRE